MAESFVQQMSDSLERKKQDMDAFFVRVRANPVSDQTLVTEIMRFMGRMRKAYLERMSNHADIKRMLQEEVKFPAATTTRYVSEAVLLNYVTILKETARYVEESRLWENMQDNTMMYFLAHLDAYSRERYSPMLVFLTTMLRKSRKYTQIMIPRSSDDSRFLVFLPKKTDLSNVKRLLKLYARSFHATVTVGDIREDDGPDGKEYVLNISYTLPQVK